MRPSRIGILVVATLLVGVVVGGVAAVAADMAATAGSATVALPSSPAASPTSPSPAPPMPSDGGQAAAVPSLDPVSPVPVPSLTAVAAPTAYRGPVTRVVPVLMYHHIGDPPPGEPYPALFVTAADFDAQMQALHDAGWRTITAGQLGAAMAANRPVPARTVVITFDDGGRDGFTTAFPILQRYGFVATFAVIGAGGGGRMTPSQLATLAAAGMEIANHTLGHHSVSRLKGARLLQQIAGGAQRIEAQLASQGVQAVIRTFVYPSGHVGPAAVALLAQLGYTGAFTEAPGSAVIGRTPPLRIPRIRVSYRESIAEFLHRLPAGVSG